MRFDRIPPRTNDGNINVLVEVPKGGHTKYEDGQHLDALVLSDEPTYPGILIETRLVGALRVEKDDTPVEHRLLCVPCGEPQTR